MMEYPVPEVPETDDVLCMQIYIPDKREYRVAFWTSLYHLGKWSSWEKDGTDRATRAAQVWKPLIEQARVRYEADQGCGGDLMDVRQNPSLPCKLEKNLGLGWEVFADLLLCQRDDMTVAPFPDGMTDSDREQYIANILEAVRLLFHYGSPGSTPSQLVTAWRNSPTYLHGYFGPSLAQIAYSLAPIMAEPEAVTGKYDLDNLADPIYQDLGEAVACMVEPDGHWLDRAADALFDFLNSSADWLYRALNAAFTPLSKRQLEDIGGGGAGFVGNASLVFPAGLECVYCVRFDFSTGEHGWQPDPELAIYTPTTGATYTGSHWEGVWRTGPQNLTSVNIIKQFGDVSNVSRITARIDAGSGPHGGYTVKFDDGPRREPSHNIATIGIVPGEYTYEWVGDGDISALAIYTASEAQETIRILWVEIEGSYGPIPPGGVTCPE